MASSAIQAAPRHRWTFTLNMTWSSTDAMRSRGVPSSAKRSLAFARRGVRYLVQRRAGRRHCLHEVLGRHRSVGLVYLGILSGCCDRQPDP
jgi:hypothetical protein